MKTPVPDYLTHVLQQCDNNSKGKLADYIPELAQADPNLLGLALCMSDGTLYSMGDDEVEFTIQSISKPFAYALAIRDHGLAHVLACVGVEPSGEAFNQISLDDDSKPKNPMINSGAITTHALIKPSENEARAERLRTFLSELAGRELRFDEQVYSSEIKTAFRNRSIAYMLRTVGALEEDPEHIVNGYIRQCSILVTVKDLANISSVLANGGVHPQTGKRILSRDLVRHVLSVMMGCGMYDAAGDWLTTVGIPAKSGVAGGIIGVLPGQVAISVFSPKLDEHGNSVRGIDIFERLSRDMGLHLMDGISAAQTIVQRRYQPENDPNTVIYELVGALQFAEAERLLRILASSDIQASTLILDLTSLVFIHDVGRRMLFEGIRRLQQDQLNIKLVDPEHWLDQAEVKEQQIVCYADLDTALRDTL